MVSSDNSNQKRFKLPEHPRLEPCVLQWFTLYRNENIPISGQLIKDTPKTFPTKLDIKCYGESDGWLTNF